MSFKKLLLSPIKFNSSIVILTLLSLPRVSSISAKYFLILSV